MTSDAGGLLLRETDRRMNLLPRLAQCFKGPKTVPRIGRGRASRFRVSKDTLQRILTQAEYTNVVDRWQTVHHWKAALTRFTVLWTIGFALLPSASC